MLASLAEFKFIQSFRIPVEDSDDIRFLLERPRSDRQSGDSDYIDDARLVDISMGGLGFSTKERLSLGAQFTISIQYKKIHLDVDGKIIRAFSNPNDDEVMIYGFEFDKEEDISKFLENFIHGFSFERLRDCVTKLATQEKYSNSQEGFEMFSLILSLFKDMTRFGNKEEFIETMLSEVVRIMNAQRASVFLINPETNELEAIAALGTDKQILKFDYRLGVAGSVFTTGLALNIDTKKDQSRFTNIFDEKTGFETQSIICNPIQNREDKTIGVIEILNKKNQDRFTVEDEKTMKVISLIFSSVFHNYNPISETSQIRRFSTPVDREYALIGNSKYVDDLRSAIIKLKDVDSPVLIQGEAGTGKALMSRILHFEGARGLKKYDKVNCAGKEQSELEQEIFGGNGEVGKLESCAGGTLLIQEINYLNEENQQRLARTMAERGVEGSPLSLDTRIIASTTEKLDKLAAEGHFDSGLFDILSTALVKVVPLRRRPEDIEEIANYFLKVECKRQGFLLKNLAPAIMKTFKDYHWPGNVEELKKCVERVVLYNPKSHIITNVTNLALPVFDSSRAEIPLVEEIPQLNDPRLNLKDRVLLIERQIILSEIKKHFGNKSHAAKSMGISREALRKKLHQSQAVLDKLGEQERVYNPDEPTKTHTGVQRKVA